MKFIYRIELDILVYPYIFANNNNNNNYYYYNYYYFTLLFFYFISVRLPIIGAV